MTSTQKIIKYAAIALAVLIITGIISAVAGILGWVLGLGGSAVGDNQTYTPEGEINSLVLEIGGADLKIIESEIFTVESNLKNLDVRVSGGSLIIKDKTRGNANYNGASLTLSIPKNFTFKNVEISTGAGKLTADSISAEELELEIGAGECTINSLTVTHSASIEGGAGAVSILGGSIKNLKLEMGTGKLILSAALLGKSELDLGIGEVEVALHGTRDDYTLEFNKGIGEITLDGEDLPSTHLIGNGERTVEINGGIGKIDVTFE